MISQRWKPGRIPSGDHINPVFGYSFAITIDCRVFNKSDPVWTGFHSHVLDPIFFQNETPAALPPMPPEQGLAHPVPRFSEVFSRFPLFEELESAYAMYNVVFYFEITI